MELKLPFFIPGDRQRTPLKASVMNRIVSGLNQFLGLRAGPGIVITRAEAGWVIGWDPNSPGETLDDPGQTPFGGGGGAGAKFRGEWNNATTYAIGDIVWRATNAELVAGKGGMFISTVANTNQAPPNYGTDFNDYWRVWPDINLRLREVRICVAGTEKKMLVMGTDPFDV
jgi:hypothetical protein